MKLLMDLMTQVSHSTSGGITSYKLNNGHAYA